MSYDTVRAPAGTKFGAFAHHGMVSFQSYREYRPARHRRARCFREYFRRIWQFCLLKKVNRYPLPVTWLETFLGSQPVLHEALASGDKVLQSFYESKFSLVIRKVIAVSIRRRGACSVVKVLCGLLHPQMECSMAATKAPDFATDLHQQMLCRTICCKSAPNLVES